jgi:hypothetical protein
MPRLEVGGFHLKSQNGETRRGPLPATGRVAHPFAHLAKGAGFDFALPVSPDRPNEGNLSEVNSRLQGASLKAAAT